MISNFTVKCNECGYEDGINKFEFDHDGNIVCPECEMKENLGIA